MQNILLKKYSNKDVWVYEHWFFNLMKYDVDLSNPFLW